MKQQYYVYVYLDNTKPGNFTYGRFAFAAEPFYIGISKTQYRINKHIWESLQVERFGRHRTVKHNKIIRIIQTGQEPTRYKLYEGLTFDSAARMEKYLIKLIGRHDLGLGPLANLTDGGEGLINRIFTDEQKLQLSIRTKAMWSAGVWDDRDITGDKNGFYGKHHTTETKNKIRASIGDRSGASNGNFGKAWNEEKIAAARVRQKNNHSHLTGENNPAKRPEVRAKSSISKLGSKNPMSCRWELTTPTGEKHIINGGLEKELKKYGLTTMKMSSNKTKMLGWKLLKLGRI